MKVGLKIYTTDKPIQLEERSFADYIEVYHVPGSSADWLKNYDFEYIIHAPHAGHGVNLASKALQKSSLDAVNQALRAADILNAKLVVLHAGSTKSKPGQADMETLNQSLSQIDDPRIIIENLPYRAGFEHFFPYDYATAKEISSRFGGRICLDFSHLMVSSVALNRNPKELIAELLKLDVRLFHISDGRTGSSEDLHLPLFEGNFDLEYFKSIIEKSECKRVTLETPIVAAIQKKEYEWMKK